MSNAILFIDVCIVLLLISFTYRIFMVYKSCKLVEEANIKVINSLCDIEIKQTMREIEYFTEKYNLWKEKNEVK